MLMTAMLLSMLPTWALSVTAEDAERTPLKVEFVSSSSNVQQGETEPKDLSTVFDPTSNVRTGLASSTDVEVIGRLSEPTQITSFVVRSYYYRDRAQGIVVSFSKDGNSWTKGYTMQEVRDVTDGLVDIEIPTPDDTTKYSYVRVSKSALLGDAGTNVTWFDINFIAFYSEPERAKSTVKAEYQETLTQASTQNLDKLFDYSNTELCEVLGTKTEALVTGKLEHPTIVSDIYLSYTLARANQTAIEGSVNGEDWVQIAKVGGFVGNAQNDAEQTILHIKVEDTTAYKYLRVIRGHKYGGGWHAYSLGIVGTVVPEAPVRVDGFQLSTDGDSHYALRVIAEADEISDGKTADEYGIRISCTDENGKKWRFTKSTDKLLSYITEKVGKFEVITSAESMDCSGFYTAEIENIPNDIGLFSISVTPYAMVDGIMKVGETKVIVMDNNTVVSVKTLPLEDYTDNIKISGRSMELDDGIACDFTASGIEFNALVAGDIRIVAECSATTYYTVYVDGVRYKRLRMDEGRGEYLVAENLDVGKHNIKLVKQSHVAHNISTLLSLKMKGELIDAPADKDLLIEFVGESITCGYGVVNYPTAGVKSYGTADYTDASQAYAYKTAELLDADYSMISVSGWTLISGDVSVPEKVYNYTSYRRSATEVYTPQRAADVVVINLGTNDIGREDYADKYIPEAKEFVSAVREKNPNAIVVFAYGMMMSGETLKGFEADVQTIVRDLGASNAGVFAVKLPTNRDAGNGHPSVEGHTEAAEILADFIKKNCL